MGKSKWHRIEFDLRLKPGYEIKDAKTGAKSKFESNKAWRFEGSEVCVHKGIALWSEGWVVSHVRTGLAFGLPFKDRDDAKAAAILFDKEIKASKALTGKDVVNCCEFLWRNMRYNLKDAFVNMDVVKELLCKTGA